MTKPIDNAEFLARVRSVVRIKRTEGALREEEREQAALISELHNALGEIKTLKGFLPICVSCKKIRDDQGYWNQLEAYIWTTRTRFSPTGSVPSARKTTGPR